MEYVYKRKGNQCVFAGCVANKRDNPDRVFFRFPVKRVNICEQWITNCANEELTNLNESQLTHRYVCDRHFTRTCFTSDIRNRLEIDAVPTLLDISVTSAAPPTTTTSTTSTTPYSTDVASHTSVTWTVTSSAGTSGSYSRPATAVTSSATSAGVAASWAISPTKSSTAVTWTETRAIVTDSLTETPRKKKLKKRIQKYRTSTQKLSMKLKRLGSKTQKLTKREIYKSASNVIKNDSFNTLLGMQILHKKGTQWREEEKQLAIEMFYRSPSLYNNLRDSKQFNLPARQTISNWLNVTNLMPGISEELIQMLKRKVKNMTPQERQVVLMFDEMTIKRNLSFNEKRDIIEGFQDLGSLGRTPDLATHALMFLVRGLLKKWKIPLAYYLASNNVKGSDVSLIIKDCITAIHDIGLKVRAIVCDQGSNNRKAISELHVSKECPYFDINGSKIFVVFDVPHLLKCVRNSLIKRPIQFDGGIASWQHIEQLYNLDISAGKARALCKLTNKHIWPNSFDKMKVKLATQVLSNTVKAVLTTAVETKQLPEEALQTATFVGHLNDLFDCLNSKVPFDANPLRCAISPHRAGTDVLNRLHEALPWIHSWKTQVLTRREKERPPCFDGFIWSITAIIMLWNDLKTEGQKFLLTNRFTQDALENEFSIARQRCGYERNPSAMQFRQNLRYRIHIILMKPPETANCEMDEDPMMVGDVSGSEMSDNLSDTEGEDEDVDDPAEVSAPDLELADDSEDDNESETDDGERASHSPSAMDISVPDNSALSSQSTYLPTLETCAVQYVAGYLAMVGLKKYDCDICRMEITKEVMLDDPNELLILHRTYATKEGVSHLTAPSPAMAKATEAILSVFETNFNRVKCLRNVKESLVNLARSAITREIDWLATDRPCKPHREYILDRAIRLKLLKHALWESRAIRTQSYHRSTKMQKVKNVSNQ